MSRSTSTGIFNDGVIDQPAFNDAYGFDNHDLETIASIVDVNIFPNIRAMFGR